MSKGLPLRVTTSQ